MYTYITTYIYKYVYIYVLYIYLYIYICIRFYGATKPTAESLEFDSLTPQSPRPTGAAPKAAARQPIPGAGAPSASETPNWEETGPVIKQLITVNICNIIIFVIIL